MLVRNQFDFKSSAKEFERQLNKAESASNKTMFKIDAKTLQLRWTDIEIRRHVMPKMHKEEEKNRANSAQADDDDELPPLLDDILTKASVSSKLISYDSGSSDEENKNQANTTASAGSFNVTTDLEELD